MEKCSDEKLKEIMAEYYIYLTKGYIVKFEHNRRQIHFRTGFRVLDCEINDEKELHEYILEKYKDNEDLKKIYDLKN
jgi:hypothetical protein